MASSSATPLASDQGQALDAPVPVTRHGSGSIGPFFAVLSVIVVLTALSCAFGRACGARAEGPDAWYDCVGWAGRICSRRLHVHRRSCGGDVEAKATELLDPSSEETKQQPPPLQPQS